LGREGAALLAAGTVLEIVMKEPGPDHPITVTPNPRRIRVMLGGFIVAETTEALTLQEARLPPVLYIPRGDVRMDLLDATRHRTHCPYKGDAVHFTVSGGGLVRENAPGATRSPIGPSEESPGTWPSIPTRWTPSRNSPFSGMPAGGR
jgi:uncharacterized protein (DUF427 family)